MGPNEISKDFYNQNTRSVLGFGIYYFCTKSGKIECINVDILSHDFETDGLSVIRGFRLLRQKDFFKKIDTKNYLIWADTGTHFRCKELAHYFFSELLEKNIKVNLNFFGEKHGKNR